jgi:hypothetical protein
MIEAIDELLVKQSIVDKETEAEVPFAGRQSVLAGSASWTSTGMPD